MRRCLLINILLVIAGILLALALFGAGAVWKGRMKPSRPSVSAPAAEKGRSLPQKTLIRRSMPESENVALTPNLPRAALAETSKQVEAHQVLGRILRDPPLGLIRQISKNLPHFWEKSPGLFSSLTRSDAAGSHDSWIVGNWEVRFRLPRDSTGISFSRLQQAVQKPDVGDLFHCGILRLLTMS